MASSMADRKTVAPTREATGRMKCDNCTRRYVVRIKEPFMTHTQRFCEVHLPMHQRYRLGNPDSK